MSPIHAELLMRLSSCWGRPPLSSELTSDIAYPLSNPVHLDCKSSSSNRAKSLLDVAFFCIVQDFDHGWASIATSAHQAKMGQEHKIFIAWSWKCDLFYGECCNKCAQRNIKRPKGSDFSHHHLHLSNTDWRNVSAWKPWLDHSFNCNTETCWCFRMVSFKACNI